jgi:hypothetical protein
MHRPDVIWLLRENRTVNLLGVGETSGLMMPKRQIECLLNRELGHLLRDLIPSIIFGRRD